MLRVDVLVVGGGIQGLLVLRALTAAGASALLVTDGDLGAGQTLHSHGLLNSGTGLLTGELHDELERHVLPDLRALGVPVYGDDASYLSLPPPAVEQLAPLWRARGYEPALVPADEGPPGLTLPFPVRRAPGYHVPKRALVRALAEGMGDRIVGGTLRAAAPGYDVGLPGGGSLTVEAGGVVVAAGCGTKRLLREVLRAETALVERIGYVKSHMLCLRSPAGALPPIGTVVTPQALLVGHLNDAHDGVGAAATVSWYVTPMTAEPPRSDDAPDDASAAPDPAVVASGVAALEQLVPALAAGGDGVEATVFAGFKQDIDGQSTRPLVEVVDGERNIVVALPSVLAHAWGNAREVVERLRLVATGTGGGAAVGDGGGGDAGSGGPHGLPSVDVGHVNELCEGVVWQPWRAFAAAFSG